MNFYHILGIISIICAMGAIFMGSFLTASTLALLAAIYSVGGTLLDKISEKE